MLLTFFVFPYFTSIKRQTYNSIIPRETIQGIQHLKTIAQTDTYFTMGDTEHTLNKRKHQADDDDDEDNPFSNAKILFEKRIQR